ncbi:MAG: hypothetical protein ABW044_04040 [Cellvibrio sp.]
MRIHIKNLWLLFLPVMALVSWLLQMPPILHKNIYSEPGDHASANNFFLLENVLSEAYVLDNENLVIDNETEKHLSQAVVHMEQGFDQVLLEKTFPSAHGKRLIQLLECYTAYKQAERQLSQQYSAAQNNQLLDYRKLQLIFFGEIATTLFSDHHSFYESVSDIQLVSPTLNDIVAAPACNGIRNRE